MYVFTQNHIKDEIIKVNQIEFRVFLFLDNKVIASSRLKSPFCFTIYQ